MEKANDHINWDFIICSRDVVLEKMAILGCTCISMCFSILVNETLFGIFSSSSDLRQEDPLFHYVLLLSWRLST